MSIRNRKWKGKIAGPTQLDALLDGAPSDYSDSEEENGADYDIDAVEARQNQESDEEDEIGHEFEQEIAHVMANADMILQMHDIDANIEADPGQPEFESTLIGSRATPPILGNIYFL